MSASPANAPSGPNSVTPNSGGPPAPIQRKKAPPSIFAAKKKPTKPIPAPAQGKQPPSKPANTVNGSAKASTQPAKAPETESQEKDYTDFPIYISRRPEDRDARYHTLKIQSRLEGNKYVTINPYDESQFTRPIHLFRRNANDQAENADVSEAASGVDDKERELISARRAERQAEREANQALIAPSGGSQNKAGPNRNKKPKKKVEDKFEKPSTLARLQLAREEARPWHMEDFDGKNKWIASYEAPMSKSHAMFALTSDGFRMIPLEKWYSLKPVSRLDTKKFDAETIDKQMSQRYKPSRWWNGTQAENMQARRQTAREAQQQRIKQRRGSDDEDNVKRDEYQADVDEIDFEYGDEFQDDDEGFIYGDPQDEETKEIEQRLREEMRSANIGGSGLRDETIDWDKVEDEEKKEAREERKKQKRMRRQLQNKERRHEYDDSESELDSLLASSSESEDSEEERERLEKEAKEEEARKAAQANGDKSGASTKGNNTPSGRPEKKQQPSLKREADASDLSGNESSRKRAKLKESATGLANGARSLSPDAARRMPSGYGSGSDTDTSRPGRAKKLKLKTSPPGSPTAGSRSGTPMASRAQSPTRPGSTGPSSGGIASPSTLPFPTPEEIKNAIPDSGIDLKALVEVFKRRVGPKSKDFIALVRQNARLDPVTKLLMPSKTSTAAKQG